MSCAFVLALIERSSTAPELLANSAVCICEVVPTIKLEASELTLDACSRLQDENTFESSSVSCSAFKDVTVMGESCSW